MMTKDYAENLNHMSAIQLSEFDEDCTKEEVLPAAQLKAFSIESKGKSIARCAVFILLRPVQI